jgi:GT2 family glycosyltransferase
VPKDITAILVVHDESASAQKALAAIRNQTFSPNRIVIVDSSSTPIEFDLPSIRVSPKSKLGHSVSQALASVGPIEDGWFWLVHDDSEPKPNALAELLTAVGESDKIAQVGPMQLSAINPRKITQLGLTISRFGQIINPVRGQLDQSQHDKVQDALAVSTSSMLVQTSAYLEVGGLDDRAATLAADVDLGLRFHRHGYRVVVAPRAKVIHASLSLAGKRSKAWLGGSNNSATRKAAIQLRLVHEPFMVALWLWFFLPLTTVARVFWRLAQKRPGLIWSELRAGFWGWFTFPKRLVSRGNRGKLSLKVVAPLRASWSTVSAHNRAALEAEESAISLATFERGEHEQAQSERVKNFAESGGWLFSLLLLVVAWQQFPMFQALSGGSAVPLSSDWLSIFARTGSSWQPIGQGFVGSSDPFNWVLLALASVTFWAPNLSLVLLIWLARALAFITAWKALSLLTAKAWQRNLGALTYSLLPAFGSAIVTGEYPAVVATIVAPWLVLSVARAAGLGRSGSARSDSRTWSWVGLSGLLLAVLAAASPSAVLVALVALAVVAFTKLRRFGYLFWIPLPLGVIYLPWAWTATVGLGQPLALLAEPSLGVSGSASAVGALAPVAQWEVWGLGLVLLVALMAALTRRWVISLALAGFTLLSYLLLAFTQSLVFPADLVSAAQGLNVVRNSGHALAAVVGLGVVALAVHALSELSRKTIKVVTATALLLASSPLAWLAVNQSMQALPSDGSVVPLLLQKQAEQGTDLQLLTVDSNGDEFRVQWSPIGGTHLEDSNLAYRFAQASESKTGKYLELAGIVGNLASANGVPVGNALRENQIGYILVSNTRENANLVAALESSDQLESAGLTPFGELWRVIGVSSADLPASEHSPWSITKSAQLAALLGFLLLAIPSRPRVQKARDSEIFIDQSESDLDV